jgi:hypothetical protein
MVQQVTYFSVACFREVLVSAPPRWRDNSAETCEAMYKIVNKKYRIVNVLVLREF